MQSETYKTLDAESLCASLFIRDAKFMREWERVPELRDPSVSSTTKTSQKVGGVLIHTTTAGMLPALR